MDRFVEHFRLDVEIFRDYTRETWYHSNRETAFGAKRSLRNGGGINEEVQVQAEKCLKTAAIWEMSEQSIYNMMIH
ncbi:hypothetical protein DPV78_004362 [Talaromyces pinophilus]|nr:hypothetical protein DPV78_004362 [Talaromyces pinophilus]